MSVDPAPNEFQTQFASRAVAELRRHGIVPRVREEPLGEELAVVVEWYGTEFWVYVDGCHLLRQPIDKRFEKYDYGTLSELGEMALQSLESQLKIDVDYGRADKA